MNVIRYTCVSLFVVSFTAIYCSDDENLSFEKKHMKSSSADIMNQGIFNQEMEIDSEDINDPKMNPGMEMFAPEIGSRIDPGMEMNPGMATGMEMNPGMALGIEMNSEMLNSRMTGMKPLIGRIGINGPKNPDIKISDLGLEKPADDADLIKTVNTDLKERDKKENMTSFDLEEKVDKKPEEGLCCYISGTSS